MMWVKVTRVQIPEWSTIGYGEGIGPDGGEVTFVGDHRPMRHLGEALVDATEPVMAGIESWQLMGGQWIEEAVES